LKKQDSLHVVEIILLWQQVVNFFFNNFQRYSIFEIFVFKEEGNIYAFGCNSESQLGLGDKANDSFYSSPQRIKSLEAQDWLMLSAGAGHSCALSSTEIIHINEHL